MQSDADLMQQQIMVLTQNQSDAKVDQLKSRDMLKAGDAAEEIQKAASDEIVGMVIADAKEKLDKELEEKKEEAEKKAEEKRRTGRADRKGKRRTERRQRDDRGRSGCGKSCRQMPVFRNSPLRSLRRQRNGSIRS